jgi:ZIP family zinc transporter
MRTLLAHVELFAAIPAMTLLVAMAFARIRAPGVGARSALQHFAAGVVFATVAVELLPDITRSHAVLEVVSGFAIGVALMLVIRRLTIEAPSESAKPDTSARLPLAMLTAVGVDILMDGLLVGLGFAIGAKEGGMVTAALSAELLSLGFALGASLRGASWPRLMAVASAEAGMLLVGSAIGASFVSRLSEHALAAVLAFGCAALLFLVTEELLVEAHEAGESAFATAMFFAGFLLFLIVGMVAR